jgi:hypothetical protein
MAAPAASWASLEVAIEDITGTYIGWRTGTTSGAVASSIAAFLLQADRMVIVLDAYIQPSFFADAEIVPRHFHLDAQLGTWFRVAAEIVPRHFHADADIFGTVGPTSQPLSFPGASRTYSGLTANTLTPPFWIGNGENVAVTVTSPPGDGGDLAAFNSTTGLAYAISTAVGEHVLNVPPGLYYIISSRGNVYRPALTGSGTYKNWSVSSLTFTVGAFVELTFSLDANFVWTFVFAASVDATVKSIRTGSASIAAFIQPYFFTDAEIVPLHFHADAWIKCEFLVSAWLIRRVTGSFAASAFVRPYFRVNAIKRRTQARTMAVSSWITNPVYGIFYADAMVGWYLTVSASIKLVKYRHFTANAVLIGSRASSQTVDAFVHPYFFLDASIFRREFFLQADIFGEVTGSFTVGANFVWTWVVEVSADAFILPWFLVDTLLLRIQESIIPVNAALVWKMYGDFTLQAGITGFQTDAVILCPDLGGVFTFYAWKIESIPQKTFLVQAEKRDPGAYWDPETETWLHMHFLADAAISEHRERTATVDASFAVAGLGLFSFPVGARIRRPGIESRFWLESMIVVAQGTVVYEGSGYTEQVLTTVTERLTFPGWSDVIGGGENRISSLFYPAPDTRITITMWGWTPVVGASIGVIGDGENMWANNTGSHSAQGLIEVFEYAGTTTINMWSAYPERPHHAYSWTGAGAYVPDLTGDGMIAYQRYDTVARTRPAPTLDAWIVGTEGEPWTIDAEIVGLTKERTFSVNAEMSAAGEHRGQVVLEAHVLGNTQLWFRVDAVLVNHGFAVNAVLYHPSMTLDAYIQPFFTVSAVIFGTMSWYPLAPFIDAVIVLDTKTGTMTVQAEMSMVGELRGQWLADSVIQAEQGWRIYLSAQIGLAPTGVSIDAYIAQRVTLDAYIQPHFSLDANIRGSAYIIFPPDGSDPTDPYGHPPMVGRSFNVKIEAFIPDEIPVGNDAEIERLIWLILEAEAELEAMYCAYTHYTPQGSTAPGVTSPNNAGTGRTSTLPDAICQIGYPGAGDIDDCWVVASVWAANAAGYSYQPTVPVYRAYARNPDRPGPTGGTLTHVIRGAKGCYPSAHIRRYSSTSWDGFISLLKAGWVASLAIRSSGLPSNYRYGNQGGHQVGVAYQNGAYFIMNPLQHNGTRPREISGADLLRAARAFTGGTISAALFS